MSGCLLLDPHTLSPRNLAWALHFTLAWHQAREWPEILAPGGIPVVTLSKIPWRVNNWAGASKQKLLFGVGLPSKILFVGGLTQTWGPQGPPYQIRVYALRIGRGPANKSCSSGWVCIYIFICLGSPQPKPCNEIVK